MGEVFDLVDENEMMEEYEPEPPQTNGHAVEIPIPMQKSLPAPPIRRVAPPVDHSHMIAIITSWKDILNARLLALLSMFGTLIGFGFIMYDPNPLRLYGLAIYAILCQAPVLFLYAKKG